MVFMVMKMEQLAFSESSTPSNWKLLMLLATACWMVWICWATTDSTPISILDTDTVLWSLELQTKVREDFTITPAACGSSRFQPWEGSIRGLLDLRDYEPSFGPSFEALICIQSGVITMLHSEKCPGWAVSRHSPQCTGGCRQSYNTYTGWNIIIVRQ